MDRNTESGIQNTEARLTAETQRRGEIKPEKSPLIPLFQRRRFLPSPLWQRGVRGDLIGLIIAVLFISACGGGGGGNGPTSPSTAISFSGTNPGNNTVYMTKNSSLSSGDTLAIDVKANSMSGNVKGAAFDVDFDSTKITYSSYAEGNFFGSGSSTIAALQQGSSSKVVVGVSTVSGTVTGSGTIVTLTFKVTGNSSVAFSNYELRYSSNQAIPGITWSGGTVTVQ